MMGNLPSNSYVASTERPKFKESDFTNMDKIDAGGYAIVYKALHRTFGHVAIKELHQRDEVPIDCREIDLLLKLSHPHIVAFYGLLVSDYTKSTCRGYVMEYMPTGSLSGVIHNASLSYDGRQVVFWTMQICLGLAHLHSKGIIHRDIKPQNLLLGKTLDDLKISDFGTARNNDVDLTLTEFVGTLWYMAPEVLGAADRKQKYSVSADIYSLAITLWEITRRERPYSRLKIAHFMIATMILQGERPPLDPSPISTDFDRLIQRAWAANPGERPTITDFLAFANIANVQVILNTTVQQTGVHEVPLLIGFAYPPYLYILDVEANTWKRPSLSLPYKAWDNGSAFLNGEIYIFGGLPKEELRSAYKLTEEMEWTKLPDMIERRREICNSTVVFEGCIWVIGGFFPSYHKAVEAYDPKLNSWIRKADMNTARTWAAAAVVKEKIFVCGGRNENGSLNSVEHFDPQLSRWIFCTPMPAPRRGLAAVAQDGLLTVMGGDGGSASDEKCLSDVWRMNMDDSRPTWSFLPSMKTGRSQFTASIVDGRIMVAGGLFWKSPLSVEFFDGQAWTEGPALPSGGEDMTTTLIPKTLAQTLLTTYPLA